MKNEELMKKIRKKGIDPENLTSEDIKTLIEMDIKGQFGKEVFKDYLKESNTAYKTILDGLGSFIDTHVKSSEKYLEVLDYRMKNLMKQSENAKTDEQKEKLDQQIEAILDRLKEEVNENRMQGHKFALIAGSVATVLAGGAVFLVTRNPDVLKKGAEMIAQETVRQITK